MAAIERADVLKGVNPAAEKLKAKATAVKDSRCQFARHGSDGLW